MRRAMARPVRDPVFEYLAENQAPHAEKIALLRRHYRRCMLLSVSRDVTQLRGVYESLAESSRRRRRCDCGRAPDCGDACRTCGDGAGPLEFDLLSDADLLFVCEEGESVAALGKFAGQFMQALAASYARWHVVSRGHSTAPTRRGRRIGGNGKTFEHLLPAGGASVGGAHVRQTTDFGGSREVGDETMAAADELFQRFAGEESFLSDIVDMRAKLERAEANGRNLKTAAGGTYDVDFLTNFLLIKNGQRPKDAACYAPSVEVRRGEFAAKIQRCAPWITPPRLCGPLSMLSGWCLGRAFKIQFSSH